MLIVTAAIMDCQCHNPASVLGWFCRKGPLLTGLSALSDTMSQLVLRFFSPIFSSLTCTSVLTVTCSPERNQPTAAPATYQNTADRELQAMTREVRAIDRKLNTMTHYNMAEAIFLVPTIIFTCSLTKAAYYFCRSHSQRRTARTRPDCDNTSYNTQHVEPSVSAADLYKAQPWLKRFGEDIPPDQPHHKTTYRAPRTREEAQEIVQSLLTGRRRRFRNS